MRFNVILRYVGVVTLLNAVCMFVSAFVSLLSRVDSAFYPLLLSGLLTAALGAFPLIFVEKSVQISNKEGYMIVVGSWLMACVVGMFPYMMWGGEFDVANAWFESVSGFTTTGATILSDVESLPRGLLFWRASTHLLGGVGVVMFALVIMPSLGKTKMLLTNVELSSLAKDNYRYQTQKIVRILLFVYIGMNVAETFLLKIAGMTWFDAITHSFSTIATGGFSTKNMSVAYFDSGWIELIIGFFMFMASIHLGLIYATIVGKSNNLFRSEVVRYYTVSLLVGAVAIALSNLSAGMYQSVGQALRTSLFQVLSIASTTGFATADTNLWTPFSVAILLFFMVQCGCAGSTSGGVKCDRILLSFKVFVARLRRQQHPNAVIRIKMDNIAQDQGSIEFVMLFIVAYLSLLVIGLIINTMCGLDLVTGFSAAATSIGCVGPGFGEIGSLDNFGTMPLAVKITSPVFMLLGRLEIFGLLQLFLIKWWR